MNFNKVVLVGRLTRDPELRYTNNGTTIAHFTLAVNRDRDTDEADFIRVSVFGRLAEFAKDYLTKGKLILIEGSIRTRNWEDNKGDRHYATEVAAHRIRILEKKQATEPTPESVSEEGLDEPPF